MAKVYVIYEARSEDYTTLNDLGYSLECLKVFNNELKAISWLKNEVKYQCNRIKIENEIVYEEKDINKDELWSCIIKEERNVIVAYIYYNNEWQNTLYIKEMVVE